MPSGPNTRLVRNRSNGSPVTRSTLASARWRSGRSRCSSCPATSRGSSCRRLQAPRRGWRWSRYSGDRERGPPSGSAVSDVTRSFMGRGELGHVACDRCVDVELTRIDQQHAGGRWPTTFVSEAMSYSVAASTGRGVSDAVVATGASSASRPWRPTGEHGTGECTAVHFGRRYATMPARRVLSKPREEGAASGSPRGRRDRRSLPGALPPHAVISAARVSVTRRVMAVWRGRSRPSRGVVGRDASGEVAARSARGRAARAPRRAPMPARRSTR